MRDVWAILFQSVYAEEVKISVKFEFFFKLRNFLIKITYRISLG